MPIDIKFVALLTPPNYDSAMILRDSEGDHLTLSKQRRQTPDGFWGCKYLQGTYLSSNFKKDRPTKLIEVFVCMVDLADVDEQFENFIPNLSLPSPGIDNFTINWTTKDGESLDAKLDDLYAQFRTLTGIISDP